MVGRESDAEKNTNLAFSSMNGVSEVTGNIIRNISNTLFTGTYLNDAVVSNNLCFNGHDCGFAESMETDPKLADDYTPLANSPIIDAGITDLAYKDLDGSKNDLGAYGGPHSISQYDAQRTSSGPFVYPLVDANKSLSNTGQLKVTAIAFAKIQ